MNDLVSRYGAAGLVVLGFPCNQFGHQENGRDEEIPIMLRHVRPGNGFQPNIQLFSKVDVNGNDAHELFKFLRSELPFPADDPISLMTDPKLINWTPVTRNDISWNFEKFLLDRQGRPFRRYSRKFETSAIAADIETLLKQAPCDNK